MSKRVIELSKYIDRINADKKPNQTTSSEGDKELNDLFKTVRSIRSLKAPTLPDKEFTKRLAGKLSDRLSEKGRTKSSKRSWFVSAGAVAAVVIMVFIFNFVLPLGRLNIVNAMEKAFLGLKAYHGILEITETNAEGNSVVQAKLEVWADKEGHYYLKQLEGSNKGLITANNGEKKWQHRPDEKQSYIFPAYPDPYHTIFELGKEITQAKNALETKNVGNERIAGRDTAIIEVTPQGGDSYHLWVDKETKLPLQKESAMQNALQYKVTYTEFELESAMPEELMAYALPEGYTEVNTNPEQIVSTLEEAGQIVGFVPDVPENIPEGYTLSSISVNAASKSVRQNYMSEASNRIFIIQSVSEDELVPASSAVLGKIGDHPAEIQSPVSESIGVLGAGGAYAGNDITSIRWQQNGHEYAVIGDSSIEVMADFVESFKFGEVRIPDGGNNQVFNPKVEVPVDMEVEKNEQKSVDAGHSPWRLDPVFVAQVFVSLKISPEGIVGDYPIRYEDLKITHNTGVEAIVEVEGDKTPVRKVYLKRLVRQDSTGIWTVVGYDPAADK